KREEKPAPAPPSASKKDQRKQSAGDRAKRAPLRRALESLEKSIAKLNAERKQLDAKLTDPSTYDDPAVNVADLQREKVRLERDMAHAEHEWLVAQEAWEAA